MSFSSDIPDANDAFRYAWTFGDGGTSTQAAPTHRYEKPGVYEVTLTVTNESGERRSHSGTVRVADLALVSGKSCSAGEMLGWCWQRPLPQGNAINDVVFVDDLRGWAVGDVGTILTTTDGGATWKAQASGTQANLQKAAFSDARTGWIAASFGRMLRTVDGGLTWQMSSMGRSAEIESLQVLDANTAWVVSHSDAFVTTDGGVHWQQLPASTSATYAQILALTSPTDVWAVTYSMNGPDLVRSRDGGLTWTGAGLPPAAAGSSRYGWRMRFTSPRLGVVTVDEYSTVGGASASRTLAWHTADGGASWQALTLPSGTGSVYPPGLQVVAPNTAVLMTGSSLLQITSNLGSTWRSIPLPSVNGYWSSYRAYSESRITVTDGEGRTFLTTNAGATWAERSAAPAGLPAIHSVWFFDRREGLALAADGSSVRTVDGGRTWTTMAPLSYSHGWQRAQFSPSGHVGWIAAWPTIYRSTDRGRTWLAPAPETSLHTPYQVADFHFVDDANGWAVSRHAFTGSDALFRSSDGGMSWKAVPNTRELAGSLAIRFGDALNGIATGVPGVAWVTRDGGASWLARPTGIGTALHRLAFVDPTTVVAVGAQGAILRSTDRGLTWVRAGSPARDDLHDVRFLTTTVGYASGDAGTLLKTVDAGVSWTQQPTATTQALQSVFFVDEQTGWAGGSNGAILATASGGR